MSTAAIAKSINFALSIPRPCILIVDDDKKFLLAVRDFFKSLDYDVDTVFTPEEATPLLEAHAIKPKYRMIITDDNFDKFSRTKGHQFILKNQHLLGKAKTMIVSGAEHPSPEILKQLEEANTSYIEKNDSLDASLKELTIEDKEKQAKDIESFVKDKLVDLPSAAGGPAEVKIVSSVPQHSARPFSDETLNRLKRTIIKWLRSRGELDKPVLAYGKHVYSANEMIKHIEDETEVGREHVMMLLAEFEYSQEINEDDPPRYEDDE